jgi:non-canonical (house-cleaning) NTP pyrophosphatase
LTALAARGAYNARPVESGVSAMPLSDMQLMRGARNRAEAVRELLAS